MSETNEKTAWKTGVTRIAPNSIRVRGKEIGDLMANRSFASVVFLLLAGRDPDARESRLFEAILVSSVDHGVTPPSAVAARTVASCGVPLSTAVAAGVLAIGRHHGGAVEASMSFFYEGVKGARENGLSVEEEGRRLVAGARDAKRRLSGFGHRLHTQDPRTSALLSLAREVGLAGPHVALGEAVSAALGESAGRPMPMNVDGAIGALLCEMGFPARLGNAPFIVSRVPGLIAHAFEEETRERPMRTIVPRDALYDGPEA